MRKIRVILETLILAAALSVSACAKTDTATANAASSQGTAAGTSSEETGLDEIISLSDIPEYSGELYIAINGNVPFFTDDEMTTQSFESYSDLDSLGRCGPAFACVGQDIMPVEKRGSIQEVKPSGWHSIRYDFVDGESLYNRCHLIGYQLTGENANEKNLITGTRYFNSVGMVPFENLAADYVKETGGHIMYRVTPIFEGDNLVADGVLMEARSVEDDGESVLYCQYVYNIEPGVIIDYATGDAQIDYSFTGITSGGTTIAESMEKADSVEGTYVLNTNSMKFHTPDCDGVNDINPKNKKTYTGSRGDLIKEGYSPCAMCNP